MTIVNPGPWVDYEAVEAEVWKSQLGIIKLIEFPVRNPKMSRRAFHLYWQKHSFATCDEPHFVCSVYSKI